MVATTAAETIADSRADEKQVHLPTGSSDNNDDDNHEDRWKRLNKYGNRYNYTAPCQSFTPNTQECEMIPEYQAFFDQDSSKHSLIGEDKILFDTFFAPNLQAMSSPGTYVELGAFDGMRESNSRFFDVCLG